MSKLKKIKRELFTADVLAHAGAIMLMAALAHWYTGLSYTASVPIAALVMFVRELTQVQAAHYDNNIFGGWHTSAGHGLDRPGVFNSHHTAEWLAPAVYAWFSFWAIEIFQSGALENWP